MNLPTRPRTVLFLIADTGAGHRSAANAIHRAMRMLNTRADAAGQTPDWQAHIVDAIAECSRFPLRHGVSLYGPAITRSPQLYGRLFHLTNSSVRFERAWRACQPFVREGMRDLLERIRPDAIVSIHPLLNHITLQVLHDLRIHVPFITVVTDLVDVHCAWIAPGADACIVPTEQARQVALAAGVPARRVRLLGMPIDPTFAQPDPRPLAERRRALGLDPALRTVLIAGGGEGAGGLAESISALARQPLDAQLVIVAGRNRQLYEEVRQMRFARRMPAHVFGFVDNMPALMRAADVVVTKAGPGTICEAIACGLPILLTGAIPGQEEGNLDYVRESGLGEVATTPAALVTALRRLLQPADPRLAVWRENARRHSHAGASLEIARFVLSLLPAVGAPSAWEARPRQLPAPRLAGHGAGARLRRHSDVTVGVRGA